MAAVNITSLTRAAVTYNNVLRELPYFIFNEKAKKLQMNILKVQGEDKLINVRRKADLIRPYKPGLTLGQEKELKKFLEMSLKPETVYAEIKDNVLNYKEKNVLSNRGEVVDNKTKKHPLELFILKNMVISFNEDLLFNLFTGQRDDAVASSTTAFNGFNYKIDALIAAGEIAGENGNLVNTGAFGTGTEEAPVDDYQKLVDFLAQAHPMLRSGEVILYAGEHPINAARASFKSRVSAFEYPTLDQVTERLRSDANIPGLKIITDEILGTGDSLKLMKPGMLDIGFENETDKDYVQVRNPYEDPNEVQFWIQAGIDTRVQDIHQKVFLTNEQKNTALNYAGDY